MLQVEKVMIEDTVALHKIKEELGWHPETTFKVGIKKTIKCI